jgi:hypothetical protein
MMGITPARNPAAVQVSAFHLNTRQRHVSIDMDKDHAGQSVTAIEIHVLGSI